MRLPSVVIVATALVLDASASAYAIDQNNVYFAVSGVQYFNFEQTGFSITNGEPYGGTGSGVSGANQAGIVVNADRKSSTSVGSWFQTQVGNGQVLACKRTGEYPGELNFAVAGTLLIGAQGKTVACNSVVIGQGNVQSSNNWWIGGPNMTYANVPGGAMQKCSLQGSDQTVQITFAPQSGGNCVNNFTITMNAQ